MARAGMQVWAGRAVALRIAAACALLCSGCGCGAPSGGGESAVWVPGGPRTPIRGAFGPAAICASDDALWLACSETARGQGKLRVYTVPVRAAHVAGSERPNEPRLVATFDGETPGLALDGAQAPLVVHATRGRGGLGGGVALVSRAGSRDGTTWSAPQTILPARTDLVVVANRLLRTRSGKWLLPVVAGGTPRCLTADADGARWTLRELSGWPRTGRAPAIVECTDGTWLGFVMQDSSLARTTSRDAGVTWSAFEPVAAQQWLDRTAPFAVAPGAASTALLAWVEAPPDTGVAPPGVWTLRLGSTSATGALEPLSPLARRAGHALATPALCDAGRGNTYAWFTAQRSGSATAACVRVEPASRRIAPPGAEHSDEIDIAARATRALDLWADHTLGRPGPSQRLFIEGYTMRGLAAAHAVLGAPGTPAVRGLLVRGSDVDGGVLQARSFADWLVTGQDVNGYWPLGYKAIYAADMAAVVGLFAALAPHADAATQARWTESARKFAAALERDGLLLSTGACGVGWLETRERDEASVLRAPYLVSTALAGIETHAWLWERTGEVEFARRARAALDFTLSSMRADGSLPPFLAGELREGPHLAAAYVQEGWMAADRFLGDPEVTALLRRRLPAHVDWLLRTQHPDGTWGETADGESARTIAIPNFLIWYDRRCEQRDDVQLAIRRAAAAIVDPERWLELGILRPGKHQDVQRALAGRTLAALASREPVF